VLLKSLEIDKDVIEIDDDSEVKEVCKNVVHEVLESCRGIGKALRHNTPLIRFGRMPF